MSAKGFNAWKSDVIKFKSNTSINLLSHNFEIFEKRYCGKTIYHSFKEFLNHQYSTESDFLNKLILIKKLLELESFDDQKAVREILRNLRIFDVVSQYNKEHQKDIQEIDCCTLKGETTFFLRLTHPGRVNTNNLKNLTPNIYQELSEIWGDLPNHSSDDSMVNERISAANDIIKKIKQNTEQTESTEITAHDTYYDKKEHPPVSDNIVQYKPPPILESDYMSVQISEMPNIINTDYVLEKKAKSGIYGEHEDYICSSTNKTLSIVLVLRLAHHETILHRAPCIVDDGFPHLFVAQADTKKLDAFLGTSVTLGLKSKIISLFSPFSKPCHGHPGAKEAMVRTPTTNNRFELFGLVALKASDIERLIIPYPSKIDTTQWS